MSIFDDPEVLFKQIDNQLDMSETCNFLMHYGHFNHISENDDTIFSMALTNTVVQLPYMFSLPEINKNLTKDEVKVIEYIRHPSKRINGQLIFDGNMSIDCNTFKIFGNENDGYYFNKETPFGKCPENYDYSRLYSIITLPEPQFCYWEYKINGESITYEKYDPYHLPRAIESTLKDQLESPNEELLHRFHDILAPHPFDLFDRNNICLANWLFILRGNILIVQKKSHTDFNALRIYIQSFIEQMKMWHGESFSIDNLHVF